MADQSKSSFFTKRTCTHPVEYVRYWLLRKSRNNFVDLRYILCRILNIFRCFSHSLNTIRNPLLPFRLDELESITFPGFLLYWKWQQSWFCWWTVWHYSTLCRDLVRQWCNPILLGLEIASFKFANGFIKRQIYKELLKLPLLNDKFNNLILNCKEKTLYWRILKTKYISHHLVCDTVASIYAVVVSSSPAHAGILSSRWLEDLAAAYALGFTQPLITVIYNYTAGHRRIRKIFLKKICWKHFSLWEEHKLTKRYRNWLVANQNIM